MEERNHNRRLYRVSCRAHEIAPPGIRGRILASLARRRIRGQAAVVIALAMLLLLAMVGLAVDGGSVYAQRRTAQNAADASALAATAEMLSRYEAMVLVPENIYDVNGTAADDDAIDAKLTNYASAHGIPRSQLEAYYVRDDKQIISTVQVGSLGFVPWVQGAKGITVKNRAETDSFFMSIFGWDKVGSSATSTAFMGIAVDSGIGVSLLPVGFFTDTEHLNQMVIGREYTLINENSEYGAGNRGWIDFNDNGGSASVAKAWLTCGFNPSVTTDAQWQEYVTGQVDNPVCMDYFTETRAKGPAKHWQCGDPDCTYPGEAIDTTFVRFGEGSRGWWMKGSTGTTLSNCEDLADLLSPGVGSVYTVPMYDLWTCCGSTTKFHLLALAKFRLTQFDVDCHYRAPTPTPDSGGGGGGGGPNTWIQHWFIQGVYEGLYIPGGTGRHGDLRSTSARTVFLDN